MEHTKTQPPAVWTQEETVSGLCARYGGSLGPSVKQLQLWLNHESPPLRAACVAGLTVSRESSVLPLLVGRYWLEVYPEIRRALVSRFASRLGRKHGLMRQIRELDPDETCRRLAEGRTPKRRGFVISFNQKTVQVLGDDGASRKLGATPDGFIGFVSPHLSNPARASSTGQW